MKNKKFTIIELLIVVAVIAILVSILLPSLLNARESALRASCASQLSNIGKAITQQYVENNGTLPSYNWMRSESMRDVYICPKDDSPRTLNFYMHKEEHWAEAQTSYGFNLFYCEQHYITSYLSFVNLIVSSVRNLLR